ncbi:hypothetical protein BJV82DRAFT_667852 [Fennellomyces sp. T-0311]|nr:hypothetical protein BJV82DRAFT_667852 [Fennellomyces sp. T-0311]
MAKKALETAAIEELALSGPQGCNFNKLWSCLNESKSRPADLVKKLANNTAIELFENDQRVTTCDQLDSLRIVASPELRKRILTRELKRTETLSDSVVQVLETIASRRHEGITQFQLAKDLGETPKTIYSRVKRLEKLGLIVRYRVNSERTFTQMCYHVRFAPDGNNPANNGLICHEVVDRQMVEVLSSAKDKMMPLTDLFTALNLTTDKQIAWARNHITKRADQGVVEKVKVIADSKRIVYVKLKDPLSPVAKPSKTIGVDKEREIVGPLISGEALEKELTKQVTANPGLTSKDLYERIPNVKWTNLRKSLNRVLQKDSQYRLYTVIESHGRVRQYRYYTRDAIKEYYESRGESADLSDSEVEEANAGEKRKRAGSSVAGKRKQPPAATDTGRVTKALKDNNGNAQKKARPMKGANVTSTKRKEAIAAIVLRDSIREINNELRDEIAAAAGESESAHPIARVTVIRLAETLHGNGTIRLVRSTVPTYGGGMENKILLLHPDLNQDDAQVQQYLDRARAHKTIVPHPAKRKPVAEIHVESSHAKEQEQTPNQILSRNIVYMAPEKHWRDVMQRHGWIRSKWLRAKLLHEHLFNQTNEVIQLGDLLNGMPLNIYCQMIGIYRHSDKVEEFMQTAQKDLPISSLPQDISKEMITRYRLRSQLSMLVDILEALELLERVSMSNDQVAVRLLCVGKVRNFAVESWPVMQEFQLVALEDVQAFWKELQFVCTSSDTSINIKSGHVLDSILRPHTWVTEHILTKEQRDTLNQHLDYSSGTAPVDDTPLIVHLSRTLSIPTSRVKSYFQGFERAYHNRQKKTKQKAAWRTVVGELIRSKQVFDPAPAKKADEPTFAPTRKFLKSRSQQAVIIKKPAQIWPEVEKQALLHAYAIMQYRMQANKAPLSWAPTTQVLPQRTHENCRRKINQVKEVWPRFDDSIEVLKRQWARIYTQGIECGDLVDERPYDNRDTIPLPASTKLLEAQYDVISSHLPESKHWPATLRLYEITGNTETISNDLLLVAVVLKMIYMMPLNSYDAEKSRELFRAFKEETIHQALQYLRVSGVLSTDRHNWNRLIPGRIYNVSEKFLQTFSSQLFPRERLDQAVSFYSQLQHVQSLPAQLTSGAMVVLLDLISTGEITLCMDSEDEYFRTFGQTRTPKLKHDAITSELLDRNTPLSTTFLPNNDTPAATAPNDARVKIPNVEKVNQELSKLSSETKRIYTVLETFGPSGATWIMLKRKTEATNDRQIIENVEQLKSKGLVQQVGFSDQRLVTSYQAASWLVESAGRYFIPRMWYGTDGHVNKEVFQGCARRILLLIVEKPGIGLAQIRQSFDGHLTPAELDDILRYLAENDAIRAQTFVQEPKPRGMKGLFKSSSSLKKIDSHTIQEHTVTHYWLREGHRYWLTE